MIKHEKENKKPGYLRTRPLKADINKAMHRRKKVPPSVYCPYFKGNSKNGEAGNEIDHIIPISLWGKMGRKGDPNMSSNLQLIPHDCHRQKTQIDRKIMTFYDRNINNQELMRKVRGCNHRYKDPAKIWKCLHKTFNDYQKKKQN